MFSSALRRWLVRCTLNRKCIRESRRGKSLRRPSFEALEDRVTPALDFLDWVTVGVPDARNMDEALANTVWPGATLDYSISVPKPGSAAADGATYHVQMRYGPFNAPDAFMPAPGRPTLVSTTLGRLDTLSGLVTLDLVVGKNTPTVWNIEATAPTSMSAGASNFTTSLDVAVPELDLLDSGSKSTSVEPDFFVSPVEYMAGMWRYTVTSNCTVPHSGILRVTAPHGAYTVLSNGHVHPMQATATRVTEYLSDPIGEMLTLGNSYDVSGTSIDVSFPSLAKDEQWALATQFAPLFPSPPPPDDLQFYAIAGTQQGAVISVTPGDGIQLPARTETISGFGPPAYAFRWDDQNSMVVPDARNVLETVGQTLWPGAAFQYHGGVHKERQTI